MKPWHQAALLGTICTLVLGFYFSGSIITPTRTTNSPAQQSLPAIVPAIDNDLATDYFFDVHGHSAEEIMALLNRAKHIFEQSPSDRQSSMRIVMVLHGPDVKFFADENYAQYKSLVDLAARMDAFGFIDLKVCAASVRSRGLKTDKFPPFIEFVAYGPVEVNRLESAGYVKL